MDARLPIENIFLYVLVCLEIQKVSILLVSTWDWHYEVVRRKKLYQYCFAMHGKDEVRANIGHRRCYDSEIPSRKGKYE